MARAEFMPRLNSGSCPTSWKFDDAAEPAAGAVGEPAADAAGTTAGSPIVAKILTKTSRRRILIPSCTRRVRTGSGPEVAKAAYHPRGSVSTPTGTGELRGQSRLAPLLTDPADHRMGRCRRLRCTRRGTGAVGPPTELDRRRIRGHLVPHLRGAGRDGCCAGRRLRRSCSRWLCVLARCQSGWQPRLSERTTGAG